MSSSESMAAALEKINGRFRAREPDFSRRGPESVMEKKYDADKWW